MKGRASYRVRKYKRFIKKLDALEWHEEKSDSKNGGTFKVAMLRIDAAESRFLKELLEPHIKEKTE